MEIWKEIKGTNGYIEVSNQGRVRSLLSGRPRILKSQRDAKGYHRVRVTIERDKMTFKVHREVAKAFIPNPSTLPQVNHIDGNKENNSASNLEWVTNKDNVHHAISNGLWETVFSGVNAENEKRKKAIIGYNDTEECTKRFESVADAERYIGSRHITDVLKGKRSHAKGWTFRYERGDSVCHH